MITIGYDYHMNLRDFEYLVAVAKYKHFGLAAESCFISQPALSQQIQKLEAYLNVQIFERTNKSVLVTPVGEQIIAKAQVLLDGVQDIKELAQLYNDPFGGEFKIGAFPTIAPYLLPILAPLIHKNLPKLKLFFIEEKTDSLINKLIEGKIDVAFLSLPISNDKLESLELFQEPFLLAVSKEHPLSSLKKIDQKKLLDYKLLLLDEGHCLRNQALEICSLSGTEQQDFRATSIETLQQMVATNNGITLIPKLAAINNKNIKYIPLASPFAYRTIGLVWRKTYARKNFVYDISELIKQRIKDL